MSEDKKQDYIDSLLNKKTRKFIYGISGAKGHITKILMTTNPEPNDQTLFNINDDNLDAIRYGLQIKPIVIDEFTCPSAINLDTGEDITSEIAKPYKKKTKAELMLERAKKRKANNKTKKRKKRK